MSQQRSAADGLPPDTAISIQQLSFGYSSERPVFANLSLDVAAGERVGIIGPSGSGKSTLLLHLNGLLPAARNHTASGQIWIHRQLVTRTHLADIRRQVGLLFQDPDDQLFAVTVADDVAFGPLQLGLSATEVRDRVTRALATVDLSDFTARRTDELSLGEKKRVGLAGLLAMQPTVLGLDEPFSNLDARNRRRLVTVLQNISATQIIATHELDAIVDLCHRVVILDGGRIQAVGPTRQILSQAALLERHGLEVPAALRV